MLKHERCWTEFTPFLEGRPQRYSSKQYRQVLPSNSLHTAGGQINQTTSKERVTEVLNLRGLTKRQFLGLPLDVLSLRLGGKVIEMCI